MAFQPSLNRRRRNVASSRNPQAWRIGIVAVAVIAGLAALAFVLVRALPSNADPVTAKRELATALKNFRVGNMTAARDHARLATHADPNWGIAHAVLARFLLDLGRGDAAEAELDRAKTAGFNPDRMIQLYAHAYLLQGDPVRAIATANRTPAPYRVYAARVVARAFMATGDTARAWRQLSFLSQRVPGDSLVWSDLGQLHSDAHDLMAATAATDRALALNPANTDALLLRGKLVRDQYGLIAALPWFQAALTRDPGDHDALIEYAATLGETGRYREMLAASRRALAVKPGSPQAYYLQAVLAARAGDDDLARGLLDRTRGELSAMPGALLLGGALDYGDGAWQQAVSQWGNLVGLQPKNITARRLLAAALLRSGDSQGAIQVLRPVVARGDADSYTLSLVGRAFEQRGARDWAAQFLDRADAATRADARPFGSDRSVRDVVAKGGNDRASEVELVRSLLAANDGEAALRVARDIAGRNPGTPAAFLLVGDVQAARGQWAPAVDSYRAAADRRFDEPTALRLVDAQEAAGDRPAAANTLALFLSQNPANVAALRLSAHWQIAAGQWDAAIETLEGLRERIGNRDAALLAELGYAFIGKGDAEGAEAYAAAAYRLAPTNPAAADAWGWALYKLGDYDRAGQLLEKAVSLAPGMASLRWHLAQTYWALGRKDLAADQAKVALLDKSFGERDPAEAMAEGKFQA